MKNFRAKVDSVLLSATNAGFWAGATVFGTFLVTYLYAKGYSASEVGLVMTLMSICNIVAQPLWGYISDAKLKIRNTILLCLAASIPLVALMPLFARTTLSLFIGCCFIACFENPIKGLLDSLTNQAEIKNKYIIYGVARGCGSFFSAIASLVVGELLASWGIEWAFAIHGVLMLIAILSLFFFSGVECHDGSITLTEQPKKKADVSVSKAIKILLGNRTYVLILVSTILVNIGLKAALTFAPVMIADMGGTSAHTGYAMAVNTIGMLPCMLIYSWMYRKKKISNNWLYILGCLFTIVRIASMAMVSSINAIIAVQIINSLSYGFLQPSMICAVGDTTPIEYRSTAITLVTSGQLAISSFLGDFVAGKLVEVIGMQAMFWCCTVLAVLGTLVYIPVCKKKKGD
ncbi:MAG: MFS transporter [Clostridiales bacterium]|nr:MFS transporter [Clostridiales bacterium]